MGSLTESPLFSPITVGNVTLSNRVVMAPMTRRRASSDFVPEPIMVEYYRQRAVVPGTLLISEATAVSPRSAALPNTPGIWADEHIEAWKPVTSAVHEKGSFIYVQLWMCGRAARPGAVSRGAEVVSASDIPWDFGSPKPRSLTEAEIQQCVEDFRQGAINVVAAGFDGVELHGANGYLLDQFTQDVSNQRQDQFGGSIENRSRFPVMVAKAVVDAIGPERVGYRVSPWSQHHGMRMSDPIPQFRDIVGRLKELRLSYLHVIESRVQGNADAPQNTESIDFLANLWGRTSPIIFAGGYNAETSRKRVEDEEQKGRQVLVAFGRTFVSNPDLPLRIKRFLPVTRYNRDLFYEVGTKEGYTDYPTWEEEEVDWDAARSKEHVWPAGSALKVSLEK
ncbi:hypothetical protein QQZ08_006132 [Neonectria magnoliae]|uniref:NADH:flavin oxidoreductase/NADH oxidase N-terminal domain-containing protein n=1 Tax=Neonectria magnoliae TaxID=2732573 RepID=A0ABR1I1G5_9HYPO